MTFQIMIKGDETQAEPATARIPLCTFKGITAETITILKENNIQDFTQLDQFGDENRSTTLSTIAKRGYSLEEPAIECLTVIGNALTADTDRTIVAKWFSDTPNTKTKARICDDCDYLFEDEDCWTYDYGTRMWDIVGLHTRRPVHLCPDCHLVRQRRLNGNPSLEIVNGKVKS
jgi:hypothetical protein